MHIIFHISNLIMPAIFIAIILYGILNRVPIYDTFVEGAKDGLRTVVGIFPTLIGLMVAVGILRSSGAMDILSQVISPFTQKFGFPSEAMPPTIMRLVSSSASRGLLLDIFKTHGPDSYLGRFVSIMMSCTETVFYTMSVYFMSVKITKTRYTLAGALTANVAGIVASLIIANWLYVS